MGNIVGDYQGVICPACGHDNISGTDLCEECNQSLSEHYMTDVETLLEKSIFVRPLLHLNPRPAECVELQTSLGEVIKRLKSRNVGCVLVTGNGSELAGIFTERDVLYKVAGLIHKLESIPIESLMTPSPSTLKPSDPISHALHLMGLHGFRHVPLIDEDGLPVGYISFRDIVRFMEVELSARDV